MKTITIVCVEDERDVLNALVRDLGPFGAAFKIEPTESADEARKVVNDTLAAGNLVGLILADHLMPGTSGVDLLVELNGRPLTTATRKVLVTAHADLADTIKAVNRANLHHYIAKPWSVEELHAVVKQQLTEFVLESGENLLPFVQILDARRLLEAIAARSSDN